MCFRSTTKQVHKMLKFKISIAVVKIAWFPNFIVFFSVEVILQSVIVYVCN